MLISLIASLIVIVGIGYIFPEFFYTTTEAIGAIDFQTAARKVMLSHSISAKLPESHIGN